VDVSDHEPEPPTREQVEQWVLNVGTEMRKAAERGVRVELPVYADARMIEAAQDEARRTVRVQYAADGSYVLLAAPPDGYKLDSLEQEIDKAAQEATPTQELPKTFGEEHDAMMRRLAEAQP
jgi:hypothetical protein